MIYKKLVNRLVETLQKDTRQTYELLGDLWVTYSGKRNDITIWQKEETPSVDELRMIKDNLKEALIKMGISIDSMRHNPAEQQKKWHGITISWTVKESE